MTSPAQLAAAELNALMDDVIALFNGTRDSRTLVIDPAAMTASGTNWAEDPDSELTHVKAAAIAAEATCSLPANPGDRILGVTVRLKQVGATLNMTAKLYSTAAGVRTERASVTASATTLEFQTLALTFSVGTSYTVPADTAMTLVVTAGQVGDLFGGATAPVDHP